MDLVDKFNSSSGCKTDGCHGVLIPTKVQLVGLDGDLQCWFSCSGCQHHNFMFNSTAEVENSRRTHIARALQVATVLSGGGFADYHRVFGECLVSVY